MKRHQAPHRQAGFSLIELLVAMAITSIIVGTIFSQINTGLQSSPSEATKLDLMQESRQFMDQMSRDLRTAGYPNQRNISFTPLATDAASSFISFGLVKLDPKNLWFEGSVDGSGTVYVVRYQLDETNCSPLPCLRRTQSRKVLGDPVTGQTGTDSETEVQNVVNFANGDSTPLFTAFDTTTGTAVTSIDIDSDNQGVADINSVAITLKVQSIRLDPRTSQYPVVTLLSTVRLHNCSYYPNTGSSIMGC